MLAKLFDCKYFFEMIKNIYKFSSSESTCNLCPLILRTVTRDLY